MNKDNPVPGVLILATLDEDDSVFKRIIQTAAVRLLFMDWTTGNWEVVVSFSPLCPSDIGYLTPDTLTIQIPQQEITRIVLLKDDDQDGIPSEWEIEWGLDPNRNDANEDPDDDGLNNLQEYLNGTDPFRQ